MHFREIIHNTNIKEDIEPVINAIQVKHEHNSGPIDLN